MANFTYKKEDCDPISASDYAIRYRGGEQYAKVRGGQEFKTDFRINNTAYEVYLSGIEITNEEYDNFYPRASRAHHRAYRREMRRAGPSTP